MDRQKTHLLLKDADRNFYRLEKPAQFDVRDLLPSKTNKETVEILAKYFI